MQGWRGPGHGMVKVYRSTVNVDIFTDINYRVFFKMGDFFACIKI